MEDSTITAYVAFGFLLAMTAIGSCFTYRLFSARRYYLIEIKAHFLKAHHHLGASFVLLSYFVIGLVLFILSALRGNPWATWSWRWSVEGALFDVRTSIQKLFKPS